MAEAALVDIPTPDGVIKQFADSHLQESISAALAGVDPGHGNAILDINTDGAKAVILERVSDTWSIVAIGQVHWHGKPEFDIAVRKSW